MVTQSVDVLTAPLVEDSTTRDGYVGPKTPVETALAGVLAEILLVERVSVDDHFFDDLGADSLVMAQFCARVRKRPDLPSVSMKDIYQHPTISSLSLALAPADAARPFPSTRPWPGCWPVFWVSSRCRWMAIFSMIWVLTRW